MIEAIGRNNEESAQSWQIVTPNEVPRLKDSPSPLHALVLDVENRNTGHQEHVIYFHRNDLMRLAQDITATLDPSFEQQILGLLNKIADNTIPTSKPPGLLEEDA